MTSPIMADLQTHNCQKIFLQVNVKRGQIVLMDFIIYLQNLGDREPEKPKRPIYTSWLLNNYGQSRVDFENFFIPVWLK